MIEFPREASGRNELKRYSSLAIGSFNNCLWLYGKVPDQRRWMRVRVAEERDVVDCLDWHLDRSQELAVQG